MKRRRATIIGLLLSMTMIAGMFSACSTSDEESTSENIQSTSSGGSTTSSDAASTSGQDTQSEEAKVGAPGSDGEFDALYEECKDLTDVDAYNYFMSLKDDKGLTDDQILRFFIGLPLSTANQDAYNVYVNDGMEAYTQTYPYGSTYDNYVWEVGSGTEFVGSLQGDQGKLPFTDYLPMEGGTTIGDPNQTYTFAFVGGGPISAYGTANWDAFVWQCEQFTNVEVMAVSHQGSDDVYSSTIDTFIANDVDVAVISPRSEAVSRPSMQRLVEAGIITITLDRLTGYDDVDVAAAGNYPANGAQLGMYLVQKLYEEDGAIEANIIFMRKQAGGTDDAIRGGHFLKVISYFPGIKILQNYHDNSNRQEAYTNIESAIQQYSDVDAVICLGDHQALAAREVLNLADRMYSRDGGKKVIIATCDDSKETMMWIREGEIDMCTPYSPYTADIGVRAAAMIINGEEVPHYVIFPSIPAVLSEGALSTGDSMFNMTTMAYEDWQPYGFGPEVE